MATRHESRCVHNDENRSVHNDENPLVRTLQDYLHPARTSVPSCIIFPLNGQTFDFKPGMIQLLPTFHGMESEYPYSHVREFEEVCGSFPTQGCRLDTVLLKKIPFSLKDKAKTWLYSLRPRTIGTWLEMQTEFFKPVQKTNSLKRQMTTFSQKDTKSLPQAWERFKDSLMLCPHHGFERWRVVSHFCDGLTPKDQQFIKTMCNGNFVYKDPGDGFDFLDEIAEKSHIWSTPNTFEPNSQKAKSSINPYSGDIYHLEEDDSLKSQLATMAREVETLKLKLPPKVNSIASQEIFEICEVCWLMGHVIKECLTLLALREMLHDQANFVNQFKKPSTFTETYNPGWSNHPNFSWSNNTNNNVP
ncbi:hypothetical protein L3X38_040651 [Prunus dulcis]|uniref:Retrotransposon gag domain-containing protein n=1 Tax=Prunus dulcis TaxID=3755 RepID=A0AAD4V9W1_PRUDU|nr:hypothetical protein L3X38_040651 [Prunus dulcis]